MDEKQQDTLSYVHSVMDLHNAVESYGSVILKNGFVVNFLSNFELVENTWKVYLTLKAMGKMEELGDFLAKINGGVVTDGGNSVNVAEIVATCAVHRFDRLPIHVKDYLENTSNKILDYMTVIGGIVDFEELSEDGEDDETED